MTEKIKQTFQLRRQSGKKITLAKGNEMISANDRLHHIVKHQLTAHLRQKAKEKYTGDTPLFDKDHPCILTIEVHPPTKRKMDSPNWYPTVKALIDGLVDAGLLTDDNNEVIREVRFRTGPIFPQKGMYQLVLLWEWFNANT